MATKRTPQIAWSMDGYGPKWDETNFISRFAQCAVKCGAVGRIASMRYGDREAAAIVPEHVAKDAPDLLSKQFRAEPKWVSFVAQGVEPRNWQLRVTFMHSPPERESIAHLLLVLDDPLDQPDISERLWSTFRKTSIAGDCDVAFLHPWGRWHADRQRRPPLVTSASLESILWATFIAPSALTFFDELKLPANVHTVRWQKDGSLFLRLSDSLRDLHEKVTSKGIEAERLALVRCFEAARKRKRAASQSRR